MITVLGATGNTGGRIVRLLRESGVAVRAVGRDAGRLGVATGHGAEPWVGDAGDRAFLTRALTGATAAYVLMPFDVTAAGYAAQQEAVGTAIAGALADAGVPRVVALSSLGAELADGTGFLTTLHDQEQRLGDLDADVLFLRPGLFYESFLPALEMLRTEGVHADTVDPTVALPMVATRDVADAAATALREGFAPGIAELLGPADRTLPEAVADLGAALGVPGATYVPLPDEAMRPILLEASLPADVVELQLQMNAAFSSGTVGSTVGRTAASTTPTSLGAWAGTLMAHT